MRDVHPFRLRSASACIGAVLLAASLSSAAESVETVALDAMTEKVVFYDERLDFAVQVQNMPRLIDWLTGNGFRCLRSEALHEWMQTKIEPSAYGSVVVMPMGLATQSLNLKPGQEATWYRYLKAGGRVVWIGNPPFYVWRSVQGEPATHDVPALDRLGLSSGWGQPFGVATAR